MSDLTSRALTYEEQREVLDALAFYGDPETYFAIGFFPDPPAERSRRTSRS